MAVELVIRSKNVFTGKSNTTQALALGIAQGIITAVLPYERADELCDFQTQLIDYGEKFICPGFHDAHQHVLHSALFPSALADQYVGTSETDEVAHLVSFATTLPDTQDWVLTHGWRQSFWTDPTAAPTRHSLDVAFPNRPVALYSGDAHTLWLNSYGMVELGISDATQPPAGGSFDRDAQGHLTGVLREAAGMAYVARLVDLLSDEALMQVYRSYFQRLSSMGITSVCDMALSLIPGADSIRPDIYQRLLNADELTLRAHLFPTLTENESNLETMQGKLTGTMLQASGFKQFFDGVSSAHTAWCSEPYTNAYFSGDVGRPTVAPERMRSLVLSAASRGHAVRIHTIGDQAVHEALNIFEEATRLYGQPQQGAHTLEHIEDIQPADIDRLAKTHVIASVQPPHVVIDLSQPDRDLGSKRAARMWPFEALLQAGATLAFGTDSPVVPPTSQDVLYCAITRQMPTTHLPQGGWHSEHCIGRVDALRAYTYGSAAAVGRTHELGLLTPGMLADLAVWDTNFLTCEPEEIQQAHCLATYLGGKQIFSA